MLWSGRLFQPLPVRLLGAVGFVEPLDSRGRFWVIKQIIFLLLPLPLALILDLAFVLRAAGLVHARHGRYHARGEHSGAAG